jgi:hypothetical protein
MATDELFDWHRCFGLIWCDRLFATPHRVETERDTSTQKQLLDLLIVLGEFPDRLRDLPDGFQTLARHNLVTFKSYHEALDAWAILELLAHYVGYRKSLGVEPLDTDFRLYAVCARRPTELLRAGWLRERSPGVFALPVLGVEIRVIVIALLPQTPNNAMLHLFSADEALVEFGRQHYRPHSSHTSQVIFDLFAKYLGEGIPMGMTLEEYARLSRQRMIQTASMAERLDGITLEERLAGIPPEAVAQQLTPEQRVAGLPPEQLAQQLTPEQRLAGLTPDQIAQRLTPEQLAEFLRLAQQKAPPDPNR